jgi:hypothetical protein
MTIIATDNTVLRENQRKKIGPSAAGHLFGYSSVRVGLQRLQNMASASCECAPHPEQCRKGSAAESRANSKVTMPVGTAIISEAHEHQN